MSLCRIKYCTFLCKLLLAVYKIEIEIYIIGYLSVSMKLYPINSANNMKPDCLNWLNKHSIYISDTVGGGMHF